MFKIKGVDRNQIHIVTCMSDARRGFGLEIAFIHHLQVVTTNKYNSLTELHTQNITVTTAHIKSVAVSISRSLITAPKWLYVCIRAQVLSEWRLPSNWTKSK
jgi:hypothetical protein